MLIRQQVPTCISNFRSDVSHLTRSLSLALPQSILGKRKDLLLHRYFHKATLCHSHYDAPPLKMEAAARLLIHASINWARLQDFKRGMRKPHRSLIVIIIQSKRLAVLSLKLPVLFSEVAFSSWTCLPREARVRLIDWRCLTPTFLISPKPHFATNPFILALFLLFIMCNGLLRLRFYAYLFVHAPERHEAVLRLSLVLPRTLRRP
jgi:hypothetical protein